MFSSGSCVHSRNKPNASSNDSWICGRTASQAHSRTPKCPSAANGRIMSNRSASDSDGIAPTAKQAHPRAVSTSEVAAITNSLGRSTSTSPIKRIRATIPSASRRSCCRPGDINEGINALMSVDWFIASASERVFVSSRPLLSRSRMCGGIAVRLGYPFRSVISRKRGVSPFAGPNPDRLNYLGHKNLSIADFAGLGRGNNGLNPTL